MSTILHPDQAAIAGVGDPAKSRSAKRVHDYVVADKGTAQQALDLLVKDWTKVFKEQGKQVASQ